MALCFRILIYQHVFLESDSKIVTNDPKAKFNACLKQCHIDEKHHVEVGEVVNYDF